jgi:hypothetical protein
MEPDSRNFAISLAASLWQSAAMASKPCPCTWAQTRDELVLTFTCKDKDNQGFDGMPITQVTDADISFSWEELELRARFLHPVRASSAKWDVKRGVSVVSLRKGEAHATQWPQPFETKLAHVKVDWDRYKDEDEDEDTPIKKLPTAPPTPVTYEQLADMAITRMASANLSGSSEPERSKPGSDKWLELPNALEAPSEEKDVSTSADAATPPLGAPPLPPVISAAIEPKWVADWRGLTYPQRMVTMALCWNAQLPEARQESALRLFELLRGGGEHLAQLAAAMKGGQLGKLRLDTSVYDAEMRPQRWVTQFEAMNRKEQMAVLEIMFKTLSFEEQTLVVSTFA